MAAVVVDQAARGYLGSGLIDKVLVGFTGRALGQRA